jgi:hypothetical protein
LNDYFEAEHPELPKFEVKARPRLRVPLGLRNIGIDLRFGIRLGVAGIDLWFWRGSSLPIWHSVRASPGEYNQLINDVWVFEQLEERTRLRMFVARPIANVRDPSSWVAVYKWLGEKLAGVCDDIAAKLRSEMDNDLTPSVSCETVM